MDDPRHPVTPLLGLTSQQNTLGLAQQNCQEQVFANSHRSKRKRSNSPSHCARDSALSPYADDPYGPTQAFLSPLSSTSPGVSSSSSPTSSGVSSPLSQSSSSGSDSGSPYYSTSPADQGSPSDPPYSSPIPSHHSLPGRDTVEPDHTTSGPQHSRAVSAASRPVTPTTTCLTISSNNMTAYTSTPHSPYSPPSTPRSIQYSDNNPALLKNDDPGHQRKVAVHQQTATIKHPTQVQVAFPEVDGQEETPSRPHREQTPIERKRTRTEFEMGPYLTEHGSPLPYPTPLPSILPEETYSCESQCRSLRYYKPRNVPRKRHNNRTLSSARQLPRKLGEGIPHQIQVAFKLPFIYPRADLDQHDVRPTKRAYLAPRDYSLSPDT